MLIKSALEQHITTHQHQTQPDGLAAAMSGTPPAGHHRHAGLLMHQARRTNRARSHGLALALPTIQPSCRQACMLGRQAC